MSRKFFVPGMMGMLCIPVLQGCTSEQAPTEVSDEGLEMTQVREGVIAVDPHRCVGCGRCARVAAANFVMDGVTRKAVVISQKDSETVETAINICPVTAISKS